MPAIGNLPEVKIQNALVSPLIALCVSSIVNLLNIKLDTADLKEIVALAHLIDNFNLKPWL